MEELRHSLGSLPKVGGASASFILLLASLLPPPLELTRAEAVSSGVNCHADFCTDTSLIQGEKVLQRARGFSLHTLVGEESTS